MCSFSKLLTVVLALASAGAQIVCGCPTVAVVQPVAPAVDTRCAGAGECCHQIQPPPAAPENQQPCDKCNFKHRTEQAVPDQQLQSISHLAAAPHWVWVETVALAAPDANHQPVVDSVPAPPLLTDLFHVHSLLLN